MDTDRDRQIAERIVRLYGYALPSVLGEQIAHALAEARAETEKEILSRTGETEATPSGRATAATTEDASADTENVVHQFWRPRHGEYVVVSVRHCSVMAARCPTCIEKDRDYNAKNVGGRLGPAAFSPAYRCDCRRENKRTATTGMFA